MANLSLIAQESSRDGQDLIDTCPWVSISCLGAFRAGTISSDRLSAGSEPIPKDGLARHESLRLLVSTLWADHADSGNEETWRSHKSAGSKTQAEPGWCCCGYPNGFWKSQVRFS